MVARSVVVEAQGNLHLQRDPMFALPNLLNCVLQGGGLRPVGQRWNAAGRYRPPHPILNTTQSAATPRL
jgi:hypothetical protein